MSEIKLDEPYCLMTENGFFQVKKPLKPEKLLRRKELYELNLDYYNKGNLDYYKIKLSDDDLKKIDKAIHSKNSNSEIYLWEENGPESYSVVIYQSCLSIAVDQLVELKKDKSSIIESETSAVTESAVLDNDIQLKSTLDDIRNKYEKYYNYITHLKSEESVAVFQYDRFKHTERNTG